MHRAAVKLLGIAGRQTAANFLREQTFSSGEVTAEQLSASLLSAREWLSA
jgi:hypothetical protein